MEYLVSAAQMKRLDADTIERIGIPSMVLMERAALAVVEEMQKAKLDLRRVLVVCGSGNNGGDGFAAARLLWERGICVQAVFVGKEASMTAECRMQRQICEKCGIKISSKCEDEEYTTIIDAIFGIGLSRDVEGAYAEVIDWMNRQKADRVAADIPSGICADTGRVLGKAVRASLTVTFAAKKPGQILYPGSSYCGKVICRNIGICVPQAGTELSGGPDKSAAEAEWKCADSGEVRAFTCGKEDLQRLPKRLPHSHKGSYGKVLLIAGSEGMSGAACLCARAAYRSGCGLVRVFTPECNRQVVQTLLPEAIVTSWKHEEQALVQLFEALDWADVIGIGPGLGQSLFAERLLREVLSGTEKPLVADADALNLLACQMDLLKTRAPETDRKVPVILTPHIGEMARLTGKTKEQLLRDMIGGCQTFAQEYQVICVEKDARTVVSDGSRVYLNTSGNSGMAVGGSGDVLTGVICGLLAQGMKPYDAAVLGVFLHGLAGDLAKKRYGEHGMLAGELADCVGEVLREFSAE